MTTPENPVDPEEVISDAAGVEAETAPAAAAEPAAAEGSPASDKEAELTADLQRVSAEFANYRKRTAREVVDARAAGKALVLRELLVVVDDLERARSHGDLESGPLKSVSDKFDTVLGSLGLTAFGEEGDGFDPSIHEAVQHEGSGSDPVLGAVLRQGYQIDGKVLRNAMVAVVDRPESASASAGASDAQDEA